MVIWNLLFCVKQMLIMYVFIFAVVGKIVDQLCNNYYIISHELGGIMQSAIVGDKECRHKSRRIIVHAWLSK